MAYEQTWQFMAMRGPRVAVSAGDAGSYHAWVLKSMLKGEIGGATLGLWTVYGSCGGGVAGLDGVDRWTTTYSYATIPNAFPGVAHAWIVLSRQFTVYATTYTVYLTISSSDLGGNSQSGIRVVASLAAPTGGTTTADPTVTQVIFENAAAASITGRFYSDLANGRRFYGAVNTLGEFWFAETITGELEKGFSFHQPAGCKTNDQFPFFMQGCMASTNAGNLVPFAGKCLYTRVADYLTAGMGPGKYYNGSAGFPAIVQPPGCAILDISDVSLFDYPVWVVVGNSVTPTASHARGRLKDIGLCSGYNTASAAPSAYRPCNIGTTIRDTGTIVYTTLNQMIVPYNALLS